MIPEGFRCTPNFWGCTQMVFGMTNQTTRLNLLSFLKRLSWQYVLHFCLHTDHRNFNCILRGSGTIGDDCIDFDKGLQAGHIVCKNCLWPKYALNSKYSFCNTNIFSKIFIRNNTKKIEKVYSSTKPPPIKSKNKSKKSPAKKKKTTR